MVPVRLTSLIVGVAVYALCAGGALAGGSSGASGGSSSGGCGCVPTSHQVKVPGVSITPPSVSIGLPSVGVGYGSGSGSGSGSASGSADASAGVSTSISVSVSGSGSSSSSGVTNGALLSNFSGGGGGGGWAPEGGVTTEITDIKVDTPTIAQRICAAYKAEIRQVAIQAVCLDDKDVPHPASQISPERAVATGYEGEVFRCIAGARMQYTIADFSGQADFNHGQTIVCQKGEALYHSANGATQCRAQIPQRDCNERSLLRRFGAGIKVLALGGGQTCVAWRSETAAASVVSASGGEGRVLRP